MTDLYVSAHCEEELKSPLILICINGTANIASTTSVPTNEVKGRSLIQMEKSCYIGTVKQHYRIGRSAALTTEMEQLLLTRHKDLSPELICALRSVYASEVEERNSQEDNEDDEENEELSFEHDSNEATSTVQLETGADEERAHAKSLLRKPPLGLSREESPSTFSSPPAKRRAVSETLATGDSVGAVRASGSVLEEQSQAHLDSTKDTLPQSQVVVGAVSPMKIRKQRRTTLTTCNAVAQGDDPERQTVLENVNFWTKIIDNLPGAMCSKNPEDVNTLDSLTVPQFAELYTAPPTPLNTELPIPQRQSWSTVSLA